MRNLIGVRYAALALLSVSVHASTPSDWVPVRWQGGPLEITRRERAGSASAHPSVIRDWYSNNTLDLLKDTPINCILVTWSIGAGDEVEAKQRQLVTAYARQAHQRGIAVVGLIHAGADVKRSADTAADAHLDGVAMAGAVRDAIAGAEYARSRGLRTVALGSQDWLADDTKWDVLGTDDGSTPGIVISKDGSVRATTTSEPWIASNTWFVRSIRDRMPDRPVWLGYRLEEPSLETYVRAIADAAVAGGRWVVSLDDAQLAGLVSGEANATRTWRAITGALSFYAEHADWNALSPAADLAIVFDKASEQPDVQSEYLNLVMRRRIPYRIVDRAALGRGSLEGVQAVLATTLPKPTDAERSLLGEFARQGGLLAAGPAWSSAPGALLYKEEWPDPEQVAKDLLDAIGPELPVRFFNVSSLLAHVSSDPAGAKLVSQLVNYATMPSDFITVRVKGPYKAAYLFKPGAPPAELQLRKSGQSVEVRFKDVAVTAAVLFER